MNIRAVTTLISCMLMAGIGCNSLPRHPVSTGADAESNPPDVNAAFPHQGMMMTFEQTAGIPGQVLPPGSYLFTPDSGIDPNKVRVRITNADGSKAIAQLEMQTVAQSQFNATAKGENWPIGGLVIIVAEGRKGEPVALLKWYYSGRPVGLRFVYTDHEQRELDEETHHTLTFSPGEKVTIGRSFAAIQ